MVLFHFGRLCSISPSSQWLIQSSDPAWTGHRRKVIASSHMTKLYLCVHSARQDSQRLGRSVGLRAGHSAYLLSYHKWRSERDLEGSDV